MKYIKKPIPIEAVQLTQQMICDYLFERIPLPTGVHCGGASYHKERGEVHKAELYCDTLENSRLKVEVGCWILGPGARGEYWPVQDDVFRETYEPVTSQETRAVPEGHFWRGEINSFYCKNCGGHYDQHNRTDEAVLCPSQNR